MNYKLIDISRDKKMQAFFINYLLFCIVIPQRGLYELKSSMDWRWELMGKESTKFR
jgi:hypothetical protein